MCVSAYTLEDVCKLSNKCNSLILSETDKGS